MSEQPSKLAEHAGIDPFDRVEELPVVKFLGDCDEELKDPLQDLPLHRVVVYLGADVEEVLEYEHVVVDPLQRELQVVSQALAVPDLRAHT